MAAPTIAFLAYPVTDVQRAAAFYRDVLGLAPGEITLDFWVEFEVGGATFGVGNFEQVGKPGTAQSLALEIPDLAAFRAKLTAAGYESTEPHDLGQCAISVIVDPDGNKVWLHETRRT